MQASVQERWLGVLRARDSPSAMHRRALGFFAWELALGHSLIDKHLLLVIFVRSLLTLGLYQGTLVSRPESAQSQRSFDQL